MNIVITTTGEVRAVHNEAFDLSSIGAVSKRRASHVEPCNVALRLAFRLLRRTFGERGAISDWTRRWPCLWRVDLAPSCGPVLGPFKDRGVAIACEVNWLERNYL